MAGSSGGKEGGFPERAPPPVLRGLAGEVRRRRRRRRHLYLLRGSQVLRVAERGRGGWWQGRHEECVCGECAKSMCERARVCGCVFAGEVVEAAAPWLGAGPGGIVRFSPAGAGDLQAIPLYFRRKLTSPALLPLEAPLTVAPSPHPPNLETQSLPQSSLLPLSLSP